MDITKPTPEPPRPLPDIQGRAYGKMFCLLAKQKDPSSLPTPVRGNMVAQRQDKVAMLWKSTGRRGISPDALGCDDDLISLGLAKLEGDQTVYMKFDMSGWDE